MSVRKPLLLAAVLAAAVSAAGSAPASELVYTPRNPSFGGNPFNSDHLIGTAQAQNKYLSPSEKLLRQSNELGLLESRNNIRQGQQAIRLNELATEQSELDLRLSEQSLRANEQNLRSGEQGLTQGEQAIRLNEQAIEANERTAREESFGGRAERAVDDVVISELQEQLAAQVFGPERGNRGTFRLNGLTATYQRSPTGNTTVVQVYQGDRQIRRFTLPNPQF